MKLFCVIFPVFNLRLFDHKLIVEIQNNLKLHTLSTTTIQTHPTLDQYIQCTTESGCGWLYSEFSE
jgi:hypothetical protein